MKSIKDIADDNSLPLLLNNGYRSVTLYGKSAVRLYTGANRFLEYFDEYSGLGKKYFSNREIQHFYFKKH